MELKGGGRPRSICETDGRNNLGGNRAEALVRDKGSVDINVEMLKKQEITIEWNATEWLDNQVSQPASKMHESE